MLRTASFFLALSCAFLTPSTVAADEASLLLTGARVWTGNPDQPWATAVAVAGDRILAIGADTDVARFRGPATRVLHLPGRFVAPGFIDNHTHFDRAGELILGVNRASPKRAPLSTSSAASESPASTTSPRPSSSRSSRSCGGAVS